MATQLFKFISPRDPKEVSEDTGSTVLDISQFEAEAAYPASLMADLADVFNDATLDATETVAALNTLLNTFAASAAYMEEIEDFNADFKVYSDFYASALKSLKAAQAAGSIPDTFIDDLLDDAGVALGVDPATEPWISSADKMLVTDNLLFQMLSVADPKMISKLASVLKLLNLLERASATGSTVDVPAAIKLLKLPVGVPANFKVPNIPRAPREAVDNTELEEAIEAKYEDYQEILAAYEELVLAIERYSRTRAAEAPNPEAGGGIGIPTPGGPRGGGEEEGFDVTTLSEETQAVLTRLGIDVESGAFPILDAVRRAGERSLRTLMEHIPLQRPTIIVGGRPVPALDFDKVIKNVIWNEDETGGVIIGSNGKCGLRFPFKIANLRVVEQELLGYEPGHIAHIQNTLQGEFNEKMTRRLLRTEETFSSSYEREVTEERDTQTTDRFTLERETSKTVQEDTEVYVKGELKASYGPVSLSIGAGYSNSTSVEESNAEASSYVKEVVQRSLSRLIEKTKEERSIKTINEFEETNRHGLDNRGGDAHVVGIYRWLDELKEVRIKTYDTRMMIEIMIPQPAKYHLSNFSQNNDLQVSMEEPIHPRDLQVPDLGNGLYSIGIKSHKDVKVFNYPVVAAAYGASIEPMPQEYKSIAHVVADGGSKTSSVSNLKESKDLVIPAGYRAFEITSTWCADNGSSWANHAHVGGNWVNSSGIVGGLAPVDYEGTVGVVTVRWNSSFLGVSLHVKCKLTDQAFEEWQIKTYKAIMDAYERKKAAYDNAVAEAKANSGVRIRGTNPLYNKQLIRGELKKQALYLMSHCKFIDNVAVYDDGTVASCCEAFDKGQIIKFVDSVFEWDNLMYVLYDYFYAKKAEWKLLYNISDPDPLMNNFLRAGEARVIIPVAKGKETAVINFLTLGKPWIGDLLAMDVMDVADEFLSEDPIDDILVYGDPDPILYPDLKPLVTPTTLTILECSSGGITPTKYEIRGIQCPGTMTPVIPGVEEHTHEE